MTQKSLSLTQRLLTGHFYAGLMAAVCGLLLSVWVLLLATRSSYFDLRRIVIEGDVKHSNALTLKANMGAHIARNFWLLDSRELQKMIEAAPWVRRAVVRKQFPDTVRVRIEEHQASAIWESDVEHSYVNNFGEIFQANDDGKADGLPVFKGSDDEQSSRVMSMYVALTQVADKAGASVAAMELSKGGLWRMVIAPDLRVELGRGTEEQLQNRLAQFLHTYQQVLPSTLQGSSLYALASVDLRYQKGYSMKLRDAASVSRVE